MADNEIIPTTFPVDVQVEINLDARDISSKLNSLQVVDLIAEIDDEADDWHVTLALYHHFKQQYDAALSACPDLAAKTPEEIDDLLIEDSNPTKVG